MLKSRQKEATIPQNRHYRLKAWGIAFALFYGFGLLVFHAKADFDKLAWAQVYYVWQFIKDALAIAVVCYISETFMRLFSPLLIYSILRVCLEITSIVTGVEVNNPLIVTILFLGALAACVYFSIIYSREIWKQSY